jgi:F420-dependent oxidoreductase-like protein
VRVRVFVEPQQGATYDQLLAVARVAESNRFDGFFRSDHYYPIGGDGLPGPTDAWITLAGLSRETTRLRLGTLVTSATFRRPGPLAIAVAQVDAMSGGRIELGLGAGWFHDEHTAYGIEFPPVAERFDRLEAQLEIVTGLWSTPVGGTFNYSGPHYELKDSPALPKPTQIPGPPIIIGGFGAKRTPNLAARFASEFNLPFHGLDDTVAQYERVMKACEAADRDPATLGLSVALTVCCGADDVEVARRANNIDRDLASLQHAGAAGTPDQVIERLAAYKELGADTVYLQVLDLSDLDHLRLISDEVIAHLP